MILDARPGPALGGALDEALAALSLTELLGALTGLSCVWLVARQNVWNWPVGILNNALFFALFWRERLYADALLQLVFAALGLYGLWLWTRSAGLPEGRVSRTTRAEWLALVVATPLATALVAYVLAHHTDSPAPLWDAGVLTLSLGATYGQANKRLESWYIWIAVDVISIPLYLARSLYPTALVYAVFLALCFVGLRRWQSALADDLENAAR